MVGFDVSGDTGHARGWANAGSGRRGRELDPRSAGQYLCKRDSTLGMPGVAVCVAMHTGWAFRPKRVDGTGVADGPEMGRVGRRPGLKNTGPSAGRVGALGCSPETRRNSNFDTVASFKIRPLQVRTVRTFGHFFTRTGSSPVSFLNAQPQPPSATRISQLLVQPPHMGRRLGS
jgi:hypothetical protein